GLVSADDLRVAREAAYSAANSRGGNETDCAARFPCAEVTGEHFRGSHGISEASSTVESVGVTAYWAAYDSDEATGTNREAAAAGCSADVAERRSLSLLLRDVFGTPFRPVPFDPAWQTPTVLSLATAAYEERLLPSGHLDPDRLAILADALEDAGCD